jgi:Cell division protein FtsI/penicillin-binding protein 2
MHSARITAGRLRLTMLVVVAIVAVFVVKLVDFQVVRAQELTLAAESRRTIPVTTYGERGSIVDANGTVLADSVERYDITAAPVNVDWETGLTQITIDGERRAVSNQEAVAKIAELTGSVAADLMAALEADRKSQFAYLVKAVDLDTFTSVWDLDIAWVYSDMRPSRVYPSGAIAGNLVGFLGLDEPLSGTERRWDECLAAENGQSSYERSADGVRLPGSLVVETEPSDGGTVHLTIDADLQWFAQQKLAERAAEVGADWGTAMLVRVDTGEIVVAADWPSIDPNDLNSVGPDDAGARSFVAPFEPGSIMKPVAFAALLDQGLITPDTQLVVPGRYTEGLPAGEYITDVFAHGDLRWTATGILMNSSNIGTVMLSNRMSLEERYEYFRKFGFGQPTEVDFLGESVPGNHGRVFTPGEIDAVSAATQMFGQGITATSAQMVSLYQTLGNGGVRMPLTLVAGCEHPDGTWTDVPVPNGERVVSEYAAETTLQMMETVATQGGLRSVITVPGYRLAAKTGTGEVAENGRYGSERIVSLAGVFPADDPEYALVVTLAKPDIMKSSAAAAPTFNAIMEQVIKTFRVQPSTEPAPDLALTW